MFFLEKQTVNFTSILTPLTASVFPSNPIFHPKIFFFSFYHLFLFKGFTTILTRFPSEYLAYPRGGI